MYPCIKKKSAFVAMEFFFHFCYKDQKQRLFGVLNWDFEGKDGGPKEVLIGKKFPSDLK